MLRFFQDCLYLANAGDYLGKRRVFYPLKAHILRRHGTYDGWDLQLLTQYCWRCDGTGEDPYYFDETCCRCDGSGIWNQSEYWLERWQVGDRVFHCPVDERPEGAPRNMLTRRVTHARVDQRAAKRALFWLLLRFAPLTLLGLIRANLHERSLRWRRWVLSKYLECLSNEDKELPF
jgi:hypothetical protein